MKSNYQGFNYLATESSFRDFDKKSNINLGVFRLFDLIGIGIDQNNFIEAIAPSFSDLPFDYYDLRKLQISEIEKEFPSEAKKKKNYLIDFYLGNSELDEVLALFGKDLFLLKEKLCKLKPFRCRSVSNFEAQLKKLSWKINLIPQKPVSQIVDSSDIRCLERKYSDIHESISSMSIFTSLIQAICEMVREVDSTCTKLSMTCWHNKLVVEHGLSSSNAPEGIHQDGADYIVSALVVERKNILGGCSKIYSDDKRTELFSWSLEPGQGIFQSDSSSLLWHDVTPITINNVKDGVGHRSTFGFDIFTDKK